MYNYACRDMGWGRTGKGSNFSPLWQTLAFQDVPANSLKCPKAGVCKAREFIFSPPPFSSKLHIAKTALNEHIIQNAGWNFSLLSLVSQPCDCICFGGVTPGL